MSSTPPPWGDDQPGQSAAQPPPDPQAPAEPQPPPYGQPYGGYYGNQPQPYAAAPSGYGAQPAYGDPWGAPTKRPGTVTAASVIAIVMSSLTGAFWLVVGLFAMVAGDSVVQQLRSNADFVRALNQASMTVAQFRSALSVFGVVALVGGVLMLLAIIPAIGVLRGSNAARIVLVVLAAITALIGLFFTVSGAFVGLLWVVAGAAVIAMLFAGNASGWFSRAGVGLH
jgi:hypothetical protein